MVEFELSNEASAPRRGGEAEEGTLHRLASLKAQPGSHHHFSDVETVQLATFINARFADEPLLSSLLPVDGANPDTFFDAWGDGMLLIVLVDAACEGSVDLAFLRRRARKPLGVSVRHLTIQHFAVLNDALAGCKNIEGLRLGFVGAEDFVQGNRPVILGVGWQLVRLAILQKVNVEQRPELSGLFTPEEVEKSLGKPGQEELVLSRWFNHYLGVVGSDRQVWQFGAELADGVAWTTLLHAIDPSACPEPVGRDAETNANNVMAAVRKLGIKGVFLTEEGLVEADRKQNVMFCAQIMDAYPTLPSREDRRSHKRNKESISSSHHSKGSTVSTMYASSPITEREASYSSAPPPAPPTGSSPPKECWGFGKDWGKDTVPGGEGKVYYDSDGEVESSGGCGLGLLGLFGCVSRN